LTDTCGMTAACLRIDSSIQRSLLDDPGQRKGVARAEAEAKRGRKRPEISEL
jgi:hypothetical protein